MTQPDRRDAPPYSETQATAWLAWLAHNMQKHGQTVFLIEQLQPSWLTMRGQRWVYIMASRLTWGVVIGLMLGLYDIVIGRLGNPSFNALVCGLLGGLIGGFIDIMRSTHNPLRLEQSASPSRRTIIQCSLLSGMIFGISISLIFGLTQGLNVGLVSGLISGLVLGPFWTLRSFLRSPRDEIRTVETVEFSWAYVPKGIVNGLAVGLVLASITVLMIGVEVGLVGGLHALALRAIQQIGSDEVGESFLYTGDLVNALVFGAIFGVSVGLVSCFRPNVRDLKTIPNQGIQLSLRSATRMGKFGGPVIGVMIALVLLFGSNALGGFAYGLLVGGLCIGLWFGGLDVIQHYIVRILLWRAGAMPWNYARFLDYAANELNFLQKVGGGYMFVHRYLLEYFAALAPMDQPPRGHGAETLTS